jgi:Skp family chaperone for outer membrane proteins
MKKILLLPVMALLLFQMAAAQEQPPRRPDNIGVSDFDSFKNNAFDIVDESIRLKNDATRIDNEIKNAGSVLTSFSVDKIRQDVRALRGIKQSSEVLAERIGSLDEEGKALLGNAKNVTPRTKAPAATSNTNRSVQALDYARKNLKVVADLAEANTKKLIDELKARGEEIE